MALGSAFVVVDFARVVVFFGVTGAGDSASTISGMTFLGRPLFLTISVDILLIDWCDICAVRRWECFPHMTLLNCGDVAPI